MYVLDYQYCHHYEYLCYHYQYILLSIPPLHWEEASSTIIRTEGGRGVVLQRGYAT